MSESPPFSERLGVLKPRVSIAGCVLPYGRTMTVVSEIGWRHHCISIVYGGRGAGLLRKDRRRIALRFAPIAVEKPSKLAVIQTSRVKDADLKMAANDMVEWLFAVAETTSVGEEWWPKGLEVDDGEPSTPRTGKVWWRWKGRVLEAARHDGGHGCVDGDDIKLVTLCSPVGNPNRLTAGHGLTLFGPFIDGLEVPMVHVLWRKNADVVSGLESETEEE